MAGWWDDLLVVRGRAAARPYRSEGGAKAGFTLGSAMSSARSFSVRVIAVECHSQKLFATFFSTRIFRRRKYYVVHEDRYRIEYVPT